MVMNYLYVDDTNEFARCVMHEFYEEKENIDRLYLGSSHVFCDIDPGILDDINGNNNFNMASGNQQLITSYYLLLEADKKHDLQRVYLDLYYVCTREGQGNLHAYQSIPNSWNVINQMKPSFNKLSYMLNLSSPEYYYMTFMACKRYTGELFHPNYVAQVVQAKQSDRWKNYEYSYIDPDGKKMNERGKKGFRKDYRTPEYGNLSAKTKVTPIRENSIVPESMEYFKKIVAYCKEHDIELACIVCPMSEMMLLRTGEYDNYVNQLSELSEQYQIPYYDFNLCKRQYLDVSQDDYWSDEGHLNTYGAEVFSRFLGNFLKAQEEGKDTYNDCFYSSYDEKIQDLREELFGLEILPSQEYERYLPDIPKEQWDEYAIYKLRFLMNAPAQMIDVNVRVEQDADTKENAKMEFIREGNEVYVIFSVREQGKLSVEAKLKDSSDVIQWEHIEP